MPASTRIGCDAWLAGEKINMQISTPKTRRDKAMKLNERLTARLCVVCGARVRNQNPKTNTCDSVCTAAKKAGRNRAEQIAWEMVNPNVDENPPCCETCGMYSSQCQCWDAVNSI